MNQNYALSQALGSTMAPYPNAVNLLPHANPTNFMVPGYSLGAASAKGPSAWVYAIAFLMGAAVGGAVCIKCKPIYDAFQQVRSEF